jgi:phage tail-like protein
MSFPERRDPLRGFNFHVSLYDSTAGTGAAVTRIALQPLVANPLAGFSECSGLEMSLDTDDYNEGGRNGTVLKFPKRTRFSEIVLRKGVTRNTELFDWFQGFTRGVGKRRDGVITLRDAAGRAAVVWTFRRGLPVKYSGPTLNALQGAVAIETVAIVHEGLSQMGGGAMLANAIGDAARAVGSLF